MTVLKHQDFDVKADDEARVWRYLDFTKFVSMLDHASLYFAQSTHLGDPLEGSYPKPSSDDRRRIFAEHDLSADTFSEESRLQRDAYYINSWHLNEAESWAMWRLYLKSDEGIAVQSTIARLHAVLDAALQDIFIGEVKYIDYRTEGFHDPINTLVPFTYKARSLEHERELRGVIADWEFGESLSHGTATADDQPGIEVPIDVNQLVENVYVAPTSPPWITALVDSVARKYGYELNVRQSELGHDPLF